MSHYGDIFPTLSDFDVQRVAQVSQLPQAPSLMRRQRPRTTPDDLRRLQQELFEIQKRPEAWGLVVPLMSHHGPERAVLWRAHRAGQDRPRLGHVSPTSCGSTSHAILSLTQNAISVRCPKFVLRKLFVALASLALKLVPGHPSRWRDWIFTCVKDLVGSPGHMLDFLSIAAEEVTSADLVGPNAANDERVDVPVVDAINNTITRPFDSIRKSIHIRPALSAGMDVLFESKVADHELGARRRSGSKTLTEPLLVGWTRRAAASSRRRWPGEVSATAHSLCKLGALGDHSTAYSRRTSRPARPCPRPGAADDARAPRAALPAAAARVHRAAGYYGVDEDESEMTLGFWYLFQEALWSTDFFVEEEGEEAAVPETGEGAESQQVVMAKAGWSRAVNPE
ncbi:hypothetical protein BJ912DRAFT_936317 [Pholiota molesta]|nr:hypothetical protein BJ912DRAFT_936317 [Pholiota molesta]